MAGKVGNGWKCLEMSGKGWIWLKRLVKVEIAGLVEMAGNGWKCVEMNGIVGIG